MTDRLQAVASLLVSSLSSVHQIAAQMRDLRQQCEQHASSASIWGAVVADELRKRGATDPLPPICVQLGALTVVLTEHNGEWRMATTADAINIIGPVNRALTEEAAIPPVLAAAAPAPAPAAEEAPKKRGRPPSAAKADAVAPVQAAPAPTVETPAAVTSPVPAPADPFAPAAAAKPRGMTKDDFRGICRKTAQRILSPDPVMALIGGSVDGVDPARYVELAAALEALTPVAKAG